MNRFVQFAIGITAIAALSVPLAEVVQAQNNNRNNVVVPQPEIEEPSAYIERKLAEFKERLAELKKDDGESTSEFDADATVAAVLKSLRTLQPRTLMLSASGDPTVFNAPAPLRIDNQVFIFRPGTIKAVTPFGPFVGRDLAVDADTAAVFNLQSRLSTRWEAEVVELIPNGPCCAERVKDPNTGEETCVEAYQTFKEKKYKVDLRGLIGHDTLLPGVEYQNMNGDLQGQELSAAAVGPGRIIVSMGQNYKPVYEQCGFGPSSRDGTVVPQNVLVGADVDAGEQTVERVFDGVKFLKFGLPGLDMPEAGPRPKLDHFMVQEKAHRTVTLGAGAKGDFPMPVAKYETGINNQRYNGIERFKPRMATQTTGLGPFRVTGVGRPALQSKAAPGATTITWTLNEVASVSHTLTLNGISVELRDIDEKNAIQLDREYEAVVHVNGPVDLSKRGFTFEFGGDVRWTGGQGNVEKFGRASTVTNKFIVEEGEKPRIRIALAGPGGEVFSFEDILSVRGRTIGQIDLRAGVGAVAVAGDLTETDQIDTFFPSTNPANPVTVSANAAFVDTAGQRVSIGEALSKVGFLGRKLPDRLMASSNSEFLERTRLALSGTSHFKVKPVIGAAEIVSELSGTTDLAARLSGGDSGEFRALPIVVTSNSLRLIKSGDTFILQVRGPANMSRYRARWSRRGLQPQNLSFNQTEEGAESRLTTKERLQKVEILLNGQVMATMPGIMATLPPQIEILPFRRAAKVVNKGALGKGGEPNRQEFENSCRESTEFNIVANGFELRPGQSVRDFCADEFQRELDLAQAELKASNDETKARNKFIKKLAKSGKSLVELAEQMEVAAAVRGAPAEALGETVCVWSVIGGEGPLKVSQRVTSLRREAAGDFCFNVVTGVNTGFTPGAELRVELKLLDQGAAAGAVR